MPQTTTLLTRGLYTYPDLLGEVPAGALTEADNVVIDRDGVISPRRGFAAYGNSFGTSSDTAKALLYYKARLLRHWQHTLDYDSDGNGTFLPLSTNILEPTTGVKIKFAEMNGNFYFTSSKGIKKISATSSSNVISNGISFAGAVEALDGQGYLNDTPGWFTQDSQVAYRIVWGLKDSNANVLLGDPSERIVITNSQLSLIIDDFNKLLIALDIAANTPPVVLTGDSHATTTIDGISSTASLSVGMTVADTTNPTNIPSGTIITTIVGPNSITISQAATGTFTGDSFSFGQVLSYNNFTSLSLPTTASSTQVYDALQALSKQLDTSLIETIYYGLSGTITDITPSVNISLNGNGNYSASPSYTITNLISTDGLFAGMTVSGDGVVPGTTISNVFPSVPIVQSGNLTSNTTVTGLTTGSLSVGMTVTGPGIVAGTTIISITNGTTIVISQNALVTNNGVGLSFTNNYVTLTSSVTSSSVNSPFIFSYPTVITSINHGLITGQEITIAGTNSTPIIDTTAPVTVTVLTSNTFTIPTSVIVAGNIGTWQQFPVSVALTYKTNLASLSNPATTQQLTYLQNFYDGIVNNLNLDENISAIAKQSVGGEFSNSTQSATTNLIFTIPSQVTTAWFYQVYRSDMATSIGQGLLSDQTADDEMRLIDENNPSSQDLTNKYINFFDDVPESIRLSGANLYTNQISGSGILQENSMPPYAQDLCLWTNFLFFANTSQKHSLQINLLTTTNLTGNTFTTSWNSINTTYHFVGEVAQYTTTTLPVGSAFPASGPADYFDLYSAQNYNVYRFWFQVGSAVAPSSSGVNLIPVPILATDTADQVASKLQYAMLAASQDFGTLLSSNVITIQNNNSGFTNSPSNHVTAAGFSIVVSISGSGEQASTQHVGVSGAPTPAQQIDATARSLVRIINKNSAGGVQAFYLSGPNDLPGQILFEAIETSLIPIYFTASAPIGANFDPALPSSGTSVVSDNNAHANRIYYSKTQQPDAVPQVNYQDVGQRDYPILRILPLRDSLYILKEDGVYRLYGNDPSNFTIYLSDGSTKLLAQDTAVVLNNQVFMLSNQGVVTVSDTGVSILSRPIEGSIVPVNSFPNFTSISFGVSYEADRAYLLWVQNASTDTQATICYRYNTITNTWVDWPITKSAGVVIPDTNILYLGAGDINYVEKERKTYTRFDQADRQYDHVIPFGGVSNNILSLGDVFEAEPGDAIVQTQYLDIADYNRLINKLDLDPGVSISYAPYLAIPGDDLRSQLTLLATALDTDPNLEGGYAASISGYGSTFLDQQNAFNTLVGRLNTDPGTRFHSYTQSTGTIGWEVLVQAIDTNKQKIILTYALPLITGPFTIYKAINSNVQWAPQHCGDPSMLKRIHEGTIMFHDMSFDNAILSYSSDLYTGIQPIPFTGEGADAWGGVAFGNTTWGGDGTARPFRTYVPVPVQRCRFIQPTFEHANSMRTYAIFGVSYTWEPVSSRAYR